MSPLSYEFLQITARGEPVILRWASMFRSYGFWPIGVDISKGRIQIEVEIFKLCNLS